MVPHYSSVASVLGSWFLGKIFAQAQLNHLITYLKICRIGKILCTYLIFLNKLQGNINAANILTLFSHLLIFTKICRRL
jgi:hypothetical protein